MPLWLNLSLSLLTIAAVIQLIIWIGNRFVSPWLQRGLPNRQPFLGLIEAGFVSSSFHNSWHETDESGTVVGLVGVMDDYAVEVSTNFVSGWWKTPFYLIRVFFSADNLTIQELEIRRQDNIASSQYIRWNDEIKLTFTHIECKWIVSKAGPRRSEVVLNNINQLIAEPRKLGLKPVSYEEAKIQWQKLHN